MQARIYKVAAIDATPVLVKATTQAQALRHVAKAIYTVSVASALEVAERMGSGQVIRDATEDKETQGQEQ